MDTKLIQSRFTKSIKTYDSEAIAQKIIAKEIISGMKLLGISKLESVLEIGSGTGLLTKMLLDNFYVKKIQIIDLIPETISLQIYLSHKYPETEIIAHVGDIEQMRFTEQFDLIISSSTFHWLNDFQSFSTCMSTCLKPSGCFIFNTFGPYNLKEIKSISNIGLHYFSDEKMVAILNENLLNSN